MSNPERDEAGRYDFSNMDAMCVCGHRLGVHAADRGDTGKRPCFRDDLHNIIDVPEEDCDCEAFRKSRKEPKHHEH